jgi:hypothetical protein
MGNLDNRNILLWWKNQKEMMYELLIEEKETLTDEEMEAIKILGKLCDKKIEQYSKGGINNK